MQSSAAPKMTISRVPDDVLNSILEYSSIIELVRVSTVNSAFNNVAKAMLFKFTLSPLRDHLNQIQNDVDRTASTEFKTTQMPDEKHAFDSKAIGAEIAELAKAYEEHRVLMRNQILHFSERVDDITHYKKFIDEHKLPYKKQSKKALFQGMLVRTICLFDPEFATYLLCLAATTNLDLFDFWHTNGASLPKNIVSAFDKANKFKAESEQKDARLLVLQTDDFDCTSLYQKNVLIKAYEANDLVKFKEILATSAGKLLAGVPYIRGQSEPIPLIQAAYFDNKIHFFGHLLQFCPDSLKSEVQYQGNKYHFINFIFIQPKYAFVQLIRQQHTSNLLFFGSYSRLFNSHASNLLEVKNSPSLSHRKCGCN